MQNNSLHAEWLKRAEAALKGKPFDPARLQGRIEGPRAFRGTHTPWQVYARLDHLDRSNAKQQADDDLAHGVDGLVLTSVEAAAVLADLPLHKFAVRNEADSSGAEAIRMAVLQQAIDPARLTIDFGVHEPELVSVLHSAGFSGPYMRADGRVGHAHGLSDAEELGCALAVALQRLRTLEMLDDQTLSRSVSLTLAASQDMFGTMAKFRAARLLWSKILGASKLPDAPLALHGETSRLMFADVDAHSNILRSVAAVFGAGLGGADSLCVLPHSFHQGLPNAFARRVARNVQTLLLHEAKLWQVADAAAGAGAIETRTHATCEKAWEVMQACERGDWPVGNREASKLTPVIGVTKYLYSKPIVLDVEATT